MLFINLKRKVREEGKVQELEGLNFWTEKFVFTFMLLLPRYLFLTMTFKFL